MPVHFLVDIIHFGFVQEEAMRYREILVFLGVAFGVSYTAWITALLLPEGRSTYLYAGLSFFAMLGPLLGTLTVKQLGWKAVQPVGPLPRPGRIWAALQGVGVLYLMLWLTQFGLQTILARWQGAASISLTGETLTRFFIRTLFMPLFWLFSVFLEESGWRYFLYPEAKKWGPWAATWGVGLIWAVWHVPAAFVLGKANAGWMILNYFIYVPILHQFFAYYYDRTQSLWTSVILHAIFNGFGTAYYYTSGVMTRPDQLVIGDMRVTLWVNAGVLILLLPFSWLLFQRIQKERSATQAVTIPAGR
ncbi:MAG: CPBP family intramembrane metalloprotease [Firmicutes bacterium]|nr:CPBP family intramembrane metalloprotease [Bacillota bacterium]